MPNILGKKSGTAETAEIALLDGVKNALPCGRASTETRCIKKKISAYGNEKFGGETHIAGAIPTTLRICIFMAMTHHFHSRGGQDLHEHNVDVHPSVCQQPPRRGTWRNQSLPIPLAIRQVSQRPQEHSTALSVWQGPQKVQEVVRAEGREVLGRDGGG